VVGAALFLRDYDVVLHMSLLKEFPELPSVAADEVARIVLPAFAATVTVSHEYLPMLRNYHYGHMPVVNRGLELLARKGERLFTVSRSLMCACLFFLFFFACTLL
jgi:hypothetical protein